MKSDWLAASSFERTQEVVSAINTLSIYAKLHRTGDARPSDAGEIEQARACLSEFLDTCERLVEEAAGDRSSTVVGADPRLSHLAMQLFDSKPRPGERPREFRGTLHLAACGVPFAEVKELLRSERSDDLEALIPCLRSLRAHIEEHAHSDVVSILGDV